MICNFLIITDTHLCNTPKISDMILSPHDSGLIVWESALHLEKAFKQIASLFFPISLCFDGLTQFVHMSCVHHADEKVS